LDDKHVLVADVFVDFDEYFPIVEAFNPSIHKIHVHAPVQRHAPRHRPGQLEVRISGD
jgi:hypothetical protein